MKNLYKASQKENEICLYKDFPWKVFLLTMLADVVQMHRAISVRPQPPFGPIKPGTLPIPNWLIPEGNSDFIPFQPLPVSRLDVPHSPHPILSTGVASVPSPQLPTYEALQSGVALVHQGTTPSHTEGESVPEFERLTVVEYVALAVVGRSATWRLISELGATLYR